MTAVEILTAIVAFLKFCQLVFTEYFAARKRARENKEEFEATEAKFFEIMDAALQKARANAKQESGQAGKVEDAVDQELNNHGGQQ